MQDAYLLLAQLHERHHSLLGDSFELCCAICKEHGLKVWRMTITVADACMLRLSSIPKDHIIVDARQSTARQTWSIAHELGHYLLGHYQLETFEASYGSLERQANMFACELLMPQALMQRLVRKYSDPYYIADSLGLSEQAVEIRIRELDLSQQLPPAIGWDVPF